MNRVIFSKKKIKVFIAICLFFAYSLNSFAAIVSDNDGSAFVTKAEFDALKKSFNNQIQSYNDSIDNKIDGAIASYLAGLKISTRLELSFDKSNKYKFPLRYDTTEAFNVPRGVWYNLMHPQFSKIDYEVTSFLGPKNANKSGFVINRESETVPGTITLATKSEVTNGYKYIISQYMTTKYKYVGKVGTYAYVTKTSDTRSMDVGDGLKDYKLYKCNNIGSGKQLITYLGDYTDKIQQITQSHVFYRAVGVTTPNPFIYCMVCMCQGNFRSSANQCTNDLTQNWTRNGLLANMVIRDSGSFFTYVDGAVYSMYSLRQRLSSARTAPFALTRQVVKEDTTVSSEANDFQDENVQYIFGRGSAMPANLMGNWNLIAAVVENNSGTAQFTCISTPPNKVDKQFMFSLHPDELRVAALVPNYPTFMPTLKAKDNTEYDASDTDSFSKLPSTLVTYTDSKGNLHYFDEGMFLGYYEKKGDVNFTVNFQRNSGSGTKVKLHISKKPFSYDFNNADLLEYKISNVSGKEQELVYGTSYNVTVPSIEKDDQLYMEWVPVTSGDLAALTSFDDYHMIVED